MKMSAKILRTQPVTETTADLYKYANRTLAKKGVTVEQLADDTGVEPGTIYGYGNQNEQTLTRVCAVIVAQAQHGEAGVLDRLAERAGFLLVKRPVVSGSLDEAALQLAVDAMRETTQALEAFSAAVRDGRVSRAELDVVRREVREATEKLQGLDVFAAELCEQDVERAR